MKFNKHIKLFVKVLQKIVDQRYEKKIRRPELTDEINKEINDKRLTINKHHVPLIVNAQKKYEVNKTRYEYEFKERINVSCSNKPIDDSIIHNDNKQRSVSPRESTRSHSDKLWMPRGEDNTR